MRKLKLFVWVLGLSSALTAMAQPQSGDWEFTLGGAGSADNEFETGGFNINGSIGYFFNPHLEVALRQGVGLAAFQEHASNEWSGNTRAAIDWHFVFGKVVPFIGANIGIDYNEHDSSGSLAPELGVKCYVHEKTFLFLMGEYRWFWDKIEDIDNNADNGRFVFTLGVGFNIGGHR
jgi:hypothetical protein